MPKVYDPEQLNAEESAPVNSANPSASQTKPGKISYDTGLPKPTSPSGLSSSTTPGKALSKVPDEEKSFYTPSPLSSSTAPGKVRLGNFLGTRRRKIIFGSVAGGSVAGLVGIFMMFLPVLRLESYLSTIDQRVFGFASDAVSQRVDHLFDNYMIKHIIALKETCNGHITSTCHANYSDSGLASSLYKTWSDTKVEQKLIDEYGLKFETHKHPVPGQPRIVIRSTKTNEVINLTEGQVEKGVFSGGDRQFGKEINQFLRKETKWYQVLQRRSVRKYLVRKHGTKFWCFWACKTKDAIDTKKLDIKTKFKYKLIERVIYPMSPKLGLIMDCLVSDPSSSKCSPDSLRSKGIDRNIISDEELDDIIGRIKDRPNAKLSQILAEKLLAKIINDESAKKVVSAIPVAGQVYLAFVAIDMLDRADQCLDNYCLSKFAADINSSQYLEYYSAMRSLNDEEKAGVLSLAQVGAASTQFDEGGHQAGESAVYQAYTNPGKTTTALLGGKVYAASAQTTDKKPYLCANGQPIPKGELVCNEKKVARTFAVEDIRNNSTISSLVDMLNTYRCMGHVPGTGTCIPGLQIVVHPALKGINWVATRAIGPLAQFAIAVFEHTPGVGGLVSSIERLSTELMQYFMDKIFPLPIQADSPGRDRYDALQAGGEVAASEFGKGGYTGAGEPYGLGGKKLSPKEQVAILQDYNDQQNYDSQNSGLIAKLTDIENPSSLASRFIASMPSSFSQLAQRFATMITKPFSGLGSLWHPAFAAQASTANINAFGIPRFGYTADDPAFTADPAKYTEAYCNSAERAKAREDSKTEDPVTGIDEYSTTDPCLLEKVAVEAASSVFTNSDSLDDN
jgi:G:T-mismatch repair DNA endonuclease (very short patch repair protein)